MEEEKRRERDDKDRQRGDERKDKAGVYVKCKSLKINNYIVSKLKPEDEDGRQDEETGKRWATVCASVRVCLGGGGGDVGGVGVGGGGGCLRSCVLLLSE